MRLRGDSLRNRFDFVGIDEMTVDAYLNSFSFDLEFLTLS